LAAAASLALPVLASGCANEDAARQFRARLPALHGQPVMVLIEELGPAGPPQSGPQQRYSWGVVSIGGSGSCEIKIGTDAAGRILSSSVDGTAYACGSMLRWLRRREARYRENPGLREREARELEDLLEQLVGARRRINADTIPPREDQPKD
jgi:hypothetical protein